MQFLTLTCSKDYDYVELYWKDCDAVVVESVFECTLATIVDSVHIFTRCSAENTKPQRWIIL